VLSSLILGKIVRIDTGGLARDRHNRILGQVYLADGAWVQGELLKRGYAMVYSFRDDAPQVIEKMLTFERAARAAGAGIWAQAYWRIITPEEASQFINRFKVVEGTVVSVNPWHDNIYVNFSEHWKGNFALFISHKYADDFPLAKLKTLVGKKIRVRGWIGYHNAPQIDVTHPAQIEMQ